MVALPISGTTKLSKVLTNSAPIASR